MQSDRGYNMRRNIIGLLLFLFCGLCYAESHEEEIRTLLIESMQPKMQDDEFSPFKKDVYTLVAMKKMNSYEQEEEIWLGVWKRNDDDHYFLFSIYFIKQGYIVDQKNITGMNNSFSNLFEYEESILKTQIECFRIVPGLGTGFIYDFNRDGVDDILNFMQGGTGIYYAIETINSINRKTSLLLSIEKQDYEEICPFEFIEYQGKRGIKVHEDYKVKTDDVDYYGDTVYETRQRWSFYTWNESVGRYTREERVTSEELENVHGEPDFFEHDTPVIPVEAEKEPNEQDVIENTSDEDATLNKSTVNYLPIIGSAGVVIIALLVVLSKKRIKR